MYFKILLICFLTFALAACIQHSHQDEQAEEHEEIKFQYTSYSNDFELFAEADAFVIGETANILSHFSALPDFKAVERGKITVVLSVNGKETRQTLDNPTRKGIYSFDIKPETPGNGTLKFEITSEAGYFEVVVPEVAVFTEHEAAHEAAESTVVPKTNTTVFTKEQSWKIDYASGFPKTEPFGQAIKTTALVQSSPGGEIMITAKTNGIAVITSDNLLEGMEVAAGQTLLSVSGNNLADDNISVKYAEAESNFIKAKADYERSGELAKDKIVSEKDLIASKNQFEIAKSVYDNLNKSFNSNGQTVTSPKSGFVKRVLVKNGAYVEAGQPLVVVSQDKTLVLSADLPLKYASVLSSIQSANIRSVQNNKTYTLEELNGKVLSYGKATNSDNFLIPVSLLIDNRGDCVAGSFVEVYLKTLTNELALTAPNEALLEEQGNFFVWVQVTPELFEKREVSIGKTDGLRTEILGGLTASERIVTRGSMLIKLAQATGTLDAHSGHVH